MIAADVIVKQKKYLKATDDTFKSGKYDLMLFRDASTKINGGKSQWIKNCGILNN